jgi:malate dehydrogenase
VPDNRWFAMTRLDQNRAVAQLAMKAGVPVREVSRLAIWGNHSDTQYPDYKNAKIGGQPATSVIKDSAWFESEFIPTVAKRGAAVIKARGASSAASAANAAIESVRACVTPTAPGDCFSAGVLGQGAYGLPSSIIYSCPLTTADGRAWSIIPDFQVDSAARAKLDASAQELVDERAAVSDLLGSAV